MNSSYSMIILVVVMFAFMYFGMMRPQKKAQQKRMEMMNNMKKGDKVVTIGGLHGVIDRINKEQGTVDLDLDGVFLTFNLTAIRTVEPNATAAPAPAAKPAAEPEEESEDKPADDTPDNKD